MYAYAIATQIPSGELCVIFVPGFIVSVALNILFIAALVIMTMVLIAIRKRSGTLVIHARLCKYLCMHACMHQQFASLSQNVCKALARADNLASNNTQH